MFRSFFLTKLEKLNELNHLQDPVLSSILFCSDQAASLCPAVAGGVQGLPL